MNGSSEMAPMAPMAPGGGSPAAKAPGADVLAPAQPGTGGGDVGGARPVPGSSGPAAAGGVQYFLVPSKISNIKILPARVIETLSVKYSLDHPILIC